MLGRSRREHFSVGDDDSWLTRRRLASRVARVRADFGVSGASSSKPPMSMVSMASDVRVVTGAWSSRADACLWCVSFVRPPLDSCSTSTFICPLTWLSLRACRRAIGACTFSICRRSMVFGDRRRRAALASGDRTPRTTPGGDSDDITADGRRRGQDGRVGRGQRSSV